MRVSIGSCILTCAILALAGCAGGGKRPLEHIPSPSDTLYTDRAALHIYGTQPERALAILDSALIVGNINPFQADFLRAKVYGSSIESQRLDESIAICERLLQHDSTDVRRGASAAANRRMVLRQLMDAYRMKGDDAHWLEYAIDLADLSRELGNETEALRMEAEIGGALADLGRVDEGLSKLDGVIDALQAGAPSVDRLDAGIIARKRKIVALEGQNRYSEMIPEAEAIIRSLEDFARNPSAYAEDSFRMPPAVDRAPYCDFYTAQARGYIARAYACGTPHDLTEARKYLRLFEASDYGRTTGGRRMMIPVWKVLGQWDRILAVEAEIVRQLGPDTLNAEYAAILRDRSDAAAAQGRPTLALDYMRRYADLRQRLNAQQEESKAQEYAARYHAMEQDLKIRDTEARLARKNQTLTVVALLLLISVAFLWYYARQKHLISEKNHALVRMIREQAAARENTQSNIPDPGLFQTLDRTIREERLYTNASLQRQDVLDRFSISRRTLNDLLAAYAGGQSFTAYINAMRLQDALNLLQDNPEMSLTDIAEKVGFSPATFRDQFKRQFGMTPTEYRQNM